jgi:tight adherence protein C
MTQGLRLASIAAAAIAIFIAAYAAARTETAKDNHFGLRGLKRRRAQEKNALFAFADPILKLLARWSAFVPIDGVRRRIAATLVHAGDWLGLEVDEFVALSVLGGAMGGAAGSGAAFLLDLPGVLAPFLAGLGAALPYIAVTGEVQRRAKTIDRALPGAIDLAALCMTAGLSFPHAIEQIVEKGDPEDPLHEELSLVLRQLRLGWTRTRALASFGDRVPSQAVRSFVNAVAQSEERGTPLVDVLRIQATTLRQRRSASGEEAASRAAVLMIVPLMLILASILVFLMGPFLIQAMASGF